jgi:hypothetical protein
VQNLVSDIKGGTYTLRVSENRVLKRIFGLKRNVVTGGWRKLHNQELHNVYSSPSIIRMMKSRRMRWAGHVVCMGQKIGFCWERQKGPLGRPRHR